MMDPARAAMAFSLVEVAIALAIASFCLIAVIGLLPAGIGANRASLEQTQAAAIASSIEDDLRSTPARNPSAFPSAGTLYSPRFRLAVPAPSSPQTLFLTEEGALTNALSARYRATLRGPAQAAGAIRGGAVASILVTWPAAADPNPLLWPSNYSGAVETLAILDRN